MAIWPFWRNFVRNDFSDKNFRRYMCMDFFKNSFSDEFFHHYIYPKIVLVTKLFVTKYDLINQNGFSDEIFSSLNTVFSDENISLLEVFFIKTNRTFSDEIFRRQDF